MPAGQPPHQPTEKTRRMVEKMAGFGVPFEQIATLVGEKGIDADTLTKHYKTELVAGKAKASGKIGQTLFQKALAGDTTALIWWTKSQMRWSAAVPTNEHGEDAPNTVTRVEVVVVDAKKPDEP